MTGAGSANAMQTAPNTCVGMRPPGCSGASPTVTLPGTTRCPGGCEGLNAKRMPDTCKVGKGRSAVGTSWRAGAWASCAKRRRAWCGGGGCLTADSHLTRQGSQLACPPLQRNRHAGKQRQMAGKRLAGMLRACGKRPSCLGHSATPFSSAAASWAPLTWMTTVSSSMGRICSRSRWVSGPAGCTRSAGRGWVGGWVGGWAGGGRRQW